MVGNIVGEPGSGFGSESNKVTIFYRDGTSEPLAAMEKDNVAHALLDRINNLNRDQIEK